MNLTNTQLRNHYSHHCNQDTEHSYHPKCSLIPLRSHGPIPSPVPDEYSILLQDSNPFTNYRDINFFFNIFPKSSHILLHTNSVKCYYCLLLNYVHDDVINHHCNCSFYSTSYHHASQLRLPTNTHFPHMSNSTKVCFSRQLLHCRFGQRTGSHPSSS